MKYTFKNSFYSRTIIILSLFFFSYSNTQNENQRKPNFIVILTDDQSWVRISFLADPTDPRSKSDYYQTPNMERLARGRMPMTNGYAPVPFCSPTIKNILTDLTPTKHEYQNDRENWTNIIRKQLTIPKILKKFDFNYDTAHFGKWDVRCYDFTPEEMVYNYTDGLTSNNTGGKKIYTKQMPEVLKKLDNVLIEFLQEAYAETKFFHKIINLKCFS